MRDDSEDRNRHQQEQLKVYGQLEEEDYDEEADDDISIYNFNRDFFRSRNRMRASVR